MSRRGGPSGVGAGLEALLLQAVSRAEAGDWSGAHVIVQEHEGHPVADWIHAVAHRMEGDLGNARYWYRRCGRTFPEVSPQAELRDIRAAVEGAEAPPKEGKE